MRQLFLPPRQLPPLLFVVRILENQQVARVRLLPLHVGSLLRQQMPSILLQRKAFSLQSASLAVELQKGGQGQKQNSR